MIRGWVSARTPAPPAPLREWLGRVEVDGSAGGIGDQLLHGGLVELDAARAAPGRVRASAFHLLAADALLTYACEVALESADPHASFQEILGKAAASGR